MKATWQCVSGVEVADKSSVQSQQRSDVRLSLGAAHMNQPDGIVELCATKVSRQKFWLEGMSLMTWPTGKRGNLTTGFLMEPSAEQQSSYLRISTCAADLPLISAQTAAICCATIRILSFFYFKVRSRLDCALRVKGYQRAKMLFSLTGGARSQFRAAGGLSSRGADGGEVDLSGLKCHHFIIWRQEK